MKKTRLNLLFLLLIPVFTFAQKSKSCASNIHRSGNSARKGNSSYLKSQNLKAIVSIPESEIVRIPVVIHIIHHTKDGSIGGSNNTNISDAQILSQIRVLNEDYRKKAGTLGYNNSPVGTDLNIEFFLATVDPNGNPTNGINRVYNAQESYDVFDEAYTLSALSYWDSSKYLNIWVTSLKNDYIGFGQFPGGDLPGLDPEDVDPEIDGVIIEQSSFGDQIGTAVNSIYANGRTLTHEIGHYFGLIHTWGDEFCGTDYVDDTPQCESSNETRKCNPIFSVCGGVRRQNMIENYMDYSPDSCMNIFTKGQFSRVREVLNTNQRRNNVFIYGKFMQEVETLAVKVLENPTTGSTINVSIQTTSSNNNLNYKLFDLTGREVLGENLGTNKYKFLRIDKSKICGGVYVLSVFDDKNKISKKIVVN